MSETGDACKIGISGNEHHFSNMNLTDMHASENNMRHANRGKALIFNHEFFDRHNVDRRFGTNKDRDLLSKTWLWVRLFSIFWRQMLGSYCLWRIVRKIRQHNVNILSFPDHSLQATTSSEQTSIRRRNVVDILSVDRPWTTGLTRQDLVTWAITLCFYKAFFYKAFFYNQYIQN